METYKFPFPTESTPLLALSSHGAKTREFSQTKEQTTAIVSSGTFFPARWPAATLTTNNKHRAKTRGAHAHCTCGSHQPHPSRAPPAGQGSSPAPHCRNGINRCASRRCHGAPTTATATHIIRHAKATKRRRSTAETLRTMLRSSPASPVKPQQWTVCRSGAAVVASPPPVVAVAPRTVASAPLRALTTESAETHPVPEVRCLLLDSTSKHAQLQLCSLTSAGIIVRGSLRHCSPTTMRRRCSPATCLSTSCSQ